MSKHTRRAFLTKVARGTVYLAPVVSTLAAPGVAGGQAPPSQKMTMMNMNMNMGMGMPQNVSALPTAPWFKPPPGGSKPPGG